VHGATKERKKQCDCEWMIKGFHVRARNFSPEAINLFCPHNSKGYAMPSHILTEVKESPSLFLVASQQYVVALHLIPLHHEVNVTNTTQLLAEFQSFSLSFQGVIAINHPEQHFICLLTNTEESVMGVF
jgi:hypothetical protein